MIVLHQALIFAFGEALIFDLINFMLATFDLAKFMSIASNPLLGLFMFFDHIPSVNVSI